MKISLAQVNEAGSGRPAQLFPGGGVITAKLPALASSILCFSA